MLCSGWWSWWSAGAVVAAGGVEGEVAVELAGSGVDDADVEVGDEHDDAGSGEGPAECDVVELPVDSQGDVAAVGYSVVADAVVGVAAVGGGGFGSVGVGDGGDDSTGQGSVGSLAVVDVGRGWRAGWCGRAARP